MIIKGSDLKRIINEELNRALTESSYGSRYRYSSGRAREIGSGIRSGDETPLMRVEPNKGPDWPGASKDLFNNEVRSRLLAGEVSYLEGNIQGGGTYKVRGRYPFNATVEGQPYGSAMATNPWDAINQAIDLSARVYPEALDSPEDL